MYYISFRHIAYFSYMAWLFNSLNQLLSVCRAVGRGRGGIFVTDSTLQSTAQAFVDIQKKRNDLREPFDFFSWSVFLCVSFELIQNILQILCLCVINKIFVRNQLSQAMKRKIHFFKHCIFQKAIYLIDLLSKGSVG